MYFNGLKGGLKYKTIPVVSQQLLWKTQYGKSLGILVRMKNSVYQQIYHCHFINIHD